METRKFKSGHSAPQLEAKDRGGGGGDADVLEGRSQGIRTGSSVSPSKGGGGSRCQVESCGANLRNAKQYHRRHRVCENHAKAQVILVSGIRQRFCQQCSRFHNISEFDESKRSCRKRLAGHNERRRKHPAEPTADEASSGRSVVACGQVNIQENATYNKHFQINKVATAPSLLS